MATRKNNYQGSVLFEEKYTPQQTPVEDSLETHYSELLKKQGELIDQAAKVDESVKRGLNQVDAYTQKIDLLYDREEQMRQHFANLRFSVGISEESIKQLNEIVNKCVIDAGTKIHSTVNFELQRWRDEVSKEQGRFSIPMWPHAYILLSIIMLMFCAIMALFDYYIKH